MSKLQEIYEGFKNYTFPNMEIEKMAIERYLICAGDDIKPKCGFYNENNKRCKKCGCFLPAKTRSVKAKCPIGEW